MRFLFVRVICVLLVYALCLTTLATAQQNSAGAHNSTPLTDQDIILMAKLKFDDATIVKTIQVHDTNFDLSVPALVKLKEAGGTQTVIQAMLAKLNDGTKAPPSEHSSYTVTPVSPVSANLLEEVGVFIREQGKLLAMEPEIVNWRTGGVLKSMATAGLDKGHVNGSVAGLHSKLKLTSPTYMSPDVLEFYIHCVEGGSAAEYQLLHLWEKGDRREFRSVTGGVLHASGGAQDNVVHFDYEKIEPRIYKVTVPRLSVGEYGFLAPGASESANTASQGKIYTFEIVD
jgi:hypothetical protein